MSLLPFVPENNKNCKIQLNIVYSKPNTRFSLFFFPLRVFKFTQNASALLAAHLSAMGFALLCENRELELPGLRLIVLTRYGRVAILFASALERKYSCLLIFTLDLGYS